jgi:exopolysaccharide biosynthesis polyprenyl glycosylphosphotransferase
MAVGSGAGVAPTVSELLSGERPIAASGDGAGAASTAWGRRGPFRNADRDTVYRSLLVAADILAVVGVALAAALVSGNRGSALATVLAAPVIVFVSRLAGTYDRGDLLLRRSTLDEVPALFQVSTLLAVVAWLLDSAVFGASTGRTELVVVWAVLFVLLVVLRGAARTLARAITRPERCLLIGDQTSCELILAKFARMRSLHAVIVALADPEETFWEPADSAGAPDLKDLTSRLGIDRAVVTLTGTEDHRLVELLDAVAATGTKVSVLPTLFEVLGPPMELDHLEGLPLLSTRSLGLPPGSMAAKRTIDIIGCALGLIFLSPVLALITLAIKLDSSGPVFFRQRRVGRDGKTFEMLKFRTMVHDAEEQKEALVHLNEAVGLFKIAVDPRVTRVGRFLRRTSLDELPQLWNVLRGEMSLVGPRPLVEEEDERVEGWRRRRLQLKPGMTGHWQVSGSARIPLDEMARIDYLYVTNWSLWLDLKILIRTVSFMVSGRGM